MPKKRIRAASVDSPVEKTSCRSVDTPAVSLSSHVSPLCQSVSHANHCYARPLNFNSPNKIDGEISLNSPVSMTERELRLRERELELEFKRLELLKSNSPAAISTERSFLPDANSRSYMPSLHSLAMIMSLPKLEIETFDGSPENFVSFMNAFETYVVSKISSAPERLAYLIHYCRGPAKEAIRHCTLLPKESCYETAVAVLKSQFGRNHQIIDSVTRNVFNGSQIPQGDVMALRSLARQMQNCLIVMQQLGRIGDLNSVHNLTRVVLRLPKAIQIKWAEHVENILSLDDQPTFAQLLEMVEKRIAVCSNEFGNIAFGARRPLETTSRKAFYNVDAIEVTNAPSFCPMCKGQHQLHDCYAFKALNVRDRYEKARNFKCCFSCLLANHRVKDCRRRAQCGVDGCTKLHHSLLHTEMLDGNMANHVCSSRSRSLSGAHLGFLPVKLVGPKGEVTTYAFLDNGSDCTILKRSIASALGLSGKPASINISTLHGTRSVLCTKSKVVLSSLHEDFTCEVDPAIVVDSLPTEQAHVCNHRIIKHTADLPFQSLEDKSVGMLIGCDVPEAHIILDQRIGSRKEPFAVLTQLGWVLRGPNVNDCKSLRVNAVRTSNPSTNELILRMFNQEFECSDDPEEKQPSALEREALAIAERTVVQREGHYEVGVPWIEPRISLPNNLKLAQTRLQLLRRKLLNNIQLHERYTNIMCEHEAKGYIERSILGGNRWYVPHHAVVNPKKPEKLRIVFDCAAEYKGISLNAALLQGPDLINSLTGVLLRFRQFRVGLTADVREMFLQVQLPHTDRWAFSFLWWPDGDMDANPVVYQWRVHPFGAKSSPFCANFALKRVANDYSAHYSESVSRAIHRDFYVDDYLGSVESHKEARHLVEQLCSLLSKGGFELVKWLSNCDSIMHSLDIESKSIKSIELGSSDSCQRTLGVLWDVQNDQLQFQVITSNILDTRRNVVHHSVCI